MVDKGHFITGGLGSSLFSSRQAKEHEARIRMEKQLEHAVEILCRSLHRQMKKNADRLMEKGIDSVITELTKIDSLVFQLADTQKELAWNLDGNLLKLNLELVKETIRQIKAEGLEYHIQQVARIPGSAMIFMLNDGVFFPQEQRKQMVALTGETINFVYDSPYKGTLIARVVGKGVERHKIRVEEKAGIAYVPISDLTPRTENKIRMAQQLSRLIVSKESAYGSLSRLK